MCLPLHALELEVSVTADAVVVELREGLGPAAGAVVSVQLPTEGPSGRFTNGMRTDLATADAQGRAVFRDVQWDSSSSAITLRVNAMKDGVRAAALAERPGTKVAARALASAASTPVPAPTEQKRDSAAVFTPRPNLPAVRPAPADEDDGIPVYRGGGGWGKRILVIAAIVGGVAAAGYAVQARQATQAARGAAPLPPTGGNIVTPQPGLSIGAPVINVGRP